MDLEEAVRALWKDGIYAERRDWAVRAPAVLVANRNLQKALEILKGAKWISC